LKKPGKLMKVLMILIKYGIFHHSFQCVVIAGKKDIVDCPILEYLYDDKRNEKDVSRTHL
jgi:hypothetical protein